MKMFLSFSMILLSIFMFFITHPLSMGSLILIQTLMMCLMTGLMINTYWFSYILFLIFLGGLLVLFIYVSSIASNELFKFSFVKFNLFILLIMLMFMSIYYKNNLSWMNFNFNEEMIKFFHNYNFIFFNNENKINLTKLYNNYNYYLMLMLIIYLFITLIAVVKITNIFFGPLRSTFNF